MCLFACSGGGEESNASETLRVNAGADQSLDEELSGNLQGASSGGNGVITYSWTSDSTDITIEHPDTAVTTATFVAPSVKTTTNFLFTLTATDTDNTQASDTLILTVNPVNLDPVARIAAADISGYESLEYPMTSTIALSGSASSDADPFDTSSSEIASYLWQQIAGTSLLIGIDTVQESIELTAPELDESETITIRLTVTDQEGATDSQDLDLTILAERYTLPEAQIRATRDIFIGELVRLEGSASSLSDDAAPYTASWSDELGSEFDDSDSIQTFLTAPMVSETTVNSIELAIEDSFRNTATASVSIQVFPYTTRLMNDTGVTALFDGSELGEDWSLDYAGQDAEYGADRQVLSDVLSKIGDGNAGFDFTRLDNNGDSVEDADESFECVRDNVTGLIWQVTNDVDAAATNYYDQSFTWYSDSDNGNVEGSLNTDSASCNVTNQQCNTSDYITEVNSSGLCGFFDWRLPTPAELQSIIHYGKDTSPLVDEDFFSNFTSEETDELWYWTNQSSADGVSDDLANNAWAFDFNNGNDGFLLKSTEQRVILVRAGR